VTRLSLPLTDSRKARIKAAADRERRSAAQMAAILVDEALDARARKGVPHAD